MATKKPVKRITLPTKGKSTAKVVEDLKPTKEKSSNSDKKKRGVLGYLLVPFTGTWGYVKGSWKELRQVRWPNRSATWSLTLAVLLFTLFFVIIIVLLDYGFNYLFREVLLK